MPARYRSDDEDSARWLGFTSRPGDIVISTRSKSGTTWMQMICALLVFQRPDLPAPLPTLSPWLDWLVEPLEQVQARLDAQHHRRFLKTHTPLDGLPVVEGVTYVVVGRHPLDMAVSLHHQGDNIDRARLRALTGHPAPAGPAPARAPLHEWLVAWIDRDDDPLTHLDSLPGVMWHLRGAWARRHRDNVVLVHYDDLVDDLEGSMRGLARRLDIEVAEASWPALVRAAGFAEMRSQAERLAPDPGGVLLDPRRFFRQGTSAAGRAELTPDELARYHRRASALVPEEDLLRWLHHDPAPEGSS